MDPTNTVSSIWDGLASVVNTGLIAGTSTAIYNALNPSPAPAAAAQPAAAGTVTSNSSSMIAVLLVGALLFMALKK